MKSRVLVWLGSFVFLAASTVVAQAGPPSGGGRGMRNYNPATEITVKGTVEDVVQTTGKSGWSGTHLTLKSDDTAYAVHVGPSAYIAEQGFTLAKGDKLEITGSKTTVNGQAVLIARSITKNGKVLTLRDEQGFPKWSKGGGRGR